MCSLEDSRWILVSIFRLLSFLVSDIAFHDSDDPRSNDDAALPPPLCFSEAELHLALSFPLLFLLFAVRVLLLAGRLLFVRAPRLGSALSPSGLLHEGLEHEGAGAFRDSAMQRAFLRKASSLNHATAHRHIFCA